LAGEGIGLGEGIGRREIGRRLGFAVPFADAVAEIAVGQPVVGVDLNRGEYKLSWALSNALAEDKRFG
jgi:hypothetical protein